MYLPYEDFRTIFRNVDLSEDEYKVFAQVAESLAWRYLGYTPSETIGAIQHAIGLIVQKLYARGLRAKDLPTSENEGGVSRTYNDSEILSEDITDILDLFRRWAL